MDQEIFFLDKQLNKRKPAQTKLNRKRLITFNKTVTFPV